jgi:hypothetical protein
MALADRAASALLFHGLKDTRPGAAGRVSFAREILLLCAIACAMSVTGCARDTAQREPTQHLHEVRMAVVHAAPLTHRPTEKHEHAQPKSARLDPALLAPQSAPDCDFKKSDLKTVDPDQWAILKAEYERQCYRDAEKAARERLGLLQSSIRRRQD